MNRWRNREPTPYHRFSTCPWGERASHPPHSKGCCEFLRVGTGEAFGLRRSVLRSSAATEDGQSGAATALWIASRR